MIVILVRKFRHLRGTCPAGDIQVGFVQGRANSVAFTSVSSSRLLGNENPWPCPSSKVLQAAIRCLSFLERGKGRHWKLGSVILK